MTQMPAVPLSIFNAAPDWDAIDPSPEHAPTLGFDDALSQTTLYGCAALLHAAPVSSQFPFPDLADDPDRADAASASQVGSEFTVDVIAACAQRAQQAGVAYLLDVDLVHVAALGTFARRWSHVYRLPDSAQGVDPRLSRRDATQARLHVGADGQMDTELLADWATRLSNWLSAGATGLRLKHLNALPAQAVHRLVALLRDRHPSACLLGDTAGMTPQGLAALRGAGLDGVFSSVAWWDGHAPWMIEEYDRLTGVSRAVVATVDVHAHRSEAGLRRALWLASVTGSTLMVSGRTTSKAALALVQDALKWHRSAKLADGAVRLLSGASLGLTALLRTDGRGFASRAHPGTDGVMVVCLDEDASPRRMDWTLLRARLPAGYADLSLRTTGRATHVPLPDVLQPGDTLVLKVRRTAPITQQLGTAVGKQALAQALCAPRIAIEAITPSVDNGRFALKRALGEPVEVEADVFMDGHDPIRVEVAWRAADEIGWHTEPMTLVTNDRYRARFVPTRVGRHEYMVRAWRDTWATYHYELSKKHAAGLDIALEIEEGRALIAAARARQSGDSPLSAALDDLLEHLGHPAAATPRGKGQRRAATIAPMQAEHVTVLLSDSTAQTMHQAEHRPSASESDVRYPLNVERQAARFASWYELFPRSQSGSSRHGTFRDVIDQLPRVRDMGFDVLYFPPIHPIGLRNRKGKNNTLNAGADQPGSPYAIGSQAGGHDAVHPELGTVDDFKALVAAAHAHGLEIALDFAIQCSPDHPWLTQQPEWFQWRADGSMRYAENPPKKYEDIVNVDFYGDGQQAGARQAALWRALRDVVLFWNELGVRTFRVDNPHTKPLPFWEWMIHEVQARYPDALFLSEAFTRPKMMYRLAKAGFSQSYTYFTWREHKQEISAYLTELNSEPARNIFRPNFFVNTPDINPKFLQRGGRAGHLIRMALAGTTSGLWGVYSGFELCDATPVPGKEEYLNSEKYEIRQWDWDRPGNIVGEMTALNAIRRQNPALQTHLGLQLETVYNDQILLFSKATPERDNVLLIAISLDPDHTQSADFELPLWSFGLPDHAGLSVSDLLDGNELVWRGKHQHLMLTTDRPYAIWRLNGPA